MNLMINGLPKVSFKAMGSVNQVQSQQPQLAPQIKQDTFEKSNTKSETKVPVLNSSTQTAVPKFSEPKYTQTDIFYINDNHGRIGNMARIYSAKEFYDSQSKSSSADKLVLAAGDISAGADLHLVEAANKYMNGLGVEAISDGNHEYDANPSDIAKSKEGAKFRSLGMNLQIPKGNPLDGVIEKSFVIEKNGHKYAIIGLAPPDY